MPEMMPSNLSQQEVDKFVREANSAISRGDLAAAHAVAERGMAAGAEHVFLLKVEALWQHENGNYRESLRLFHHARTLARDDPSILNGIAACLAGMGEYEPAQKMIDAALELAPNAAAIHYLRGWICEATRDFAGARQAYERAVSLTPNYPEALGGLASVAAHTRDYSAARSSALRALALNPREPSAIVALAAAEVGSDEAPAAEARLQALISGITKPDRTKVRALDVLAAALEAQGRIPEAEAARRERDEELRRIATPAPAGA